MLKGSPPYGGVGRNLVLAALLRAQVRRPLTGAWVETLPSPGTPTRRPVAPLRGRGSKPVDRHVFDPAAPRRPLTGAWVETRSPSGSSRGLVTSPPYGGVGRNNKVSEPIAPPRASPPYGGVGRNRYPVPSLPTFRVAPLRGRGSKLVEPALAVAPRRRPLTGAWVETLWPSVSETDVIVAPLRGRGSKHRIIQWHDHCFKSPPYGGVGRNSLSQVSVIDAVDVAPLRGRGSKPDSERGQQPAEGRPLTGAWVETGQRIAEQRAEQGRPLTGAWVETNLPDPGAGTSGSPPYGGVGRNHVPDSSRSSLSTSPPYGGVGRNPEEFKTSVDGTATSPPYGGVGRNPANVIHDGSGEGRPLTGAWVETS